MPRASRHPAHADKPQVLPLRAAASGTPLVDLLASQVSAIASERRDRGLPPVSIALDLGSVIVAATEAGPLTALLRSLVEAACEAAAAAPPRLREVVVTAVAGPAGLEIEVADSGPEAMAASRGSRAACQAFAERLGGTLACRGCPEGGTAVTLHLPRRGHKRQAA